MVKLSGPASMTISQFVAALAALLKLIAQADPRWLRGLVTSLSWRRPSHSYENIRLSFELDILDPAGHRARLTREQHVRFNTSEAGVLRDLAWGDGEPIAGYRASGANAVTRRREGSVRVVWLALPERPVAGQRAKVRSTRTVVDGLRRHNEFLEARLERPTKRLTLLVVFPKQRPPLSARIDAVPSADQPARPVVARLRTDGRAVLRWSGRDPKPHAAYRISWTW